MVKSRTSRTQRNLPEATTAQRHLDRARVHLTQRMLLRLHTWQRRQCHLVQWLKRWYISIALLLASPGRSMMELLLVLHSSPRSTLRSFFIRTCQLTLGRLPKALTRALVGLNVARHPGTPSRRTAHPTILPATNSVCRMGSEFASLQRPDFARKTGPSNLSPNTLMHKFIKTEIMLL